MPLPENAPTTPANSEPPAQKEESPSGGGKRAKRVAGWLAAGLVCLLVGIVIWYRQYPDQPGPARRAVATVEIPAGVGLVGIKNSLVRAGVLRDDPRFIVLAKLMGAARQLKAGEYAFQPGLSPRAVLHILVTGKTVLHAITFPEGTTIYQAADIVQAGGWGSRENFLKLASDGELIKKFGLDCPTLEGYLFPDTYFFEKGTGLRPIVGAMVKRMLQVLEQEVGTRPELVSEAKTLASEGRAAVEKGQANAPRLTPHQTLILAAIVEKETALASERPLVAKVFLNRLRVGMKLQADPTVIYGLAKFGLPLTKEDLATPTPYNTYVTPGLPAGPICSPGRSAIDAVLHPASEDYYYFVSQNDGSHYFSKTLEEHNQAVARYRIKRLSSKKIE